MNATTSDGRCGGEPAACGTFQVDVPTPPTAVLRPPSLAPRNRLHSPEARGPSAPSLAAVCLIGVGPCLPIRLSAPERLDLSVIPAVRLPIQC